MKDPLQNMNDSELDKLFRKAAEEFSGANSRKVSSAQKEDAWEKLQEKLDAPPPESVEDKYYNGRNLKKWMLLILILIISGIIVRITDKRQKTEPHPVFMAGQKLMKKITKESGTKDIIQKAENSSISINYQGRRAGLKDGIRHTLKREENRFQITSSSDASSSIIHGQKFLLPEVFAVKSLLNNFSLQSIPNLTLTLAAQDRQIFVKSNDDHITSDNLLNNHKSGNPPASGEHIWDIGLFAGPEWSAASKNDWGMGASSGLLLDYRLGKRWLLESGMIAAKKIYQASPNDYHFPYRNTGTYTYVGNIGANCVLFEIPLNIHYMLWNNSMRSVLIGTGLSSTWMHREAYTYYLSNGSGEYDKYQEVHYNKEHQLFSMLTVSAGYEKKWNNFSLAVSPYVQTPLKGIGYGKVKLFSTGIQLTLRYGLK